jgi:hypothetical protein
LVVRMPDQPRVRLYRALRRADPTLTYFSTPEFAHSAFVSGTVTGGDFAPEPAGTRTRVLVGGETIPYSPYNFTNELGEYAFTGEQIRWNGAAAATTSLFALQTQENEDGNVLGYRGFARRDNVQLTSQGSLEMQDLALLPVTPRTLTGTVQAPAQSGDISTGLSVHFGEGAVQSLRLQTGLSSFSVPTAEISGATYSLQIVAGITGGGSSRVSLSGLPPEPAALTVVLPEPPTLVAPADRELALTAEAAFEFTVPLGGVNILRFDAIDGAQLEIITQETRLVVPDLTAYGYPFAPQSEHGWTVRNLSSYVDVDAFTQGTSDAALEEKLHQATTVTELKEASAGYRVFAVAP